MDTFGRCQQISFVAVLRGHLLYVNMGFGSYDESEQENQQADTDVDEDDMVSLHDDDHEGEVSYDSNASADELLDQLKDIKDDRDDEG